MANCISLIIVSIIFIPISTIWFNLSVDSQVWNHIYEYFFITFSINTIILTLGVALFTLFLGIIAAWITSIL